MAVVSTFIESCGGVLSDGWGGLRGMIHLPYGGGLNDQPAALMEALKAVAHGFARLIKERGGNAGKR